MTYLITTEGWYKQSTYTVSTEGWYGSKFTPDHTQCKIVDISCEPTVKVRGYVTKL